MKRIKQTSIRRVDSDDGTTFENTKNLTQGSLGVSNPAIALTRVRYT